MNPQIIVCGLDSIGYRILSLLRQQQAEVVGVNRYPIPGEDDIVVGDLLMAETLCKAGIKTAQTLVIANNDDATNLEILIQARLLNPHIRIINRLFNQSLGDRLDRTLPAHTTMSVAELSAPIFAFAAMNQMAIGHLQLFREIWPIYEERIHATHPWRDRTLRELWEDRTRMLIYYLTEDSEISLVEAMDSNREIQLGDRLIIGTRPRVAANYTSFFEKLKKSLLWLEQFRRYLRPGLIITGLLLLTIAIATCAYIAFGWRQSTVVDALYFSVGMITGAGGNEDIAEKSPAFLKVFTAIMMLIGAGVIGVFYALLNDLVLGSRLRAFWDVSRVPTKGHYVICGMGGVGIKTAQQLIAQGHQVVVIERDDNSRFLSMARSQQIPVVLADASLPLTLETANIDRATALIAVTNDDMTNLEIALTAKELAPHLSIVVRSNHPKLTHQIAQVFDFTTALNPYEIAAPAFAAAALGGRILGSGITGEILWIALSLLITPTHSFSHRTVQDIAIEADLVPLYLQSSSKNLHGWDLLKVTLKPGDVLHLTIPAKNIERLWRTHHERLEYQK
ncbi:MAG: NAD-binding protein [Phormidesmis sp.]